MTAAAPSVPPPLAPRAWLRYDLVDRLVGELRPATVLEIGCGQGSMGARLARRGRYLGVEPDAASGAVAEARVAPAGGRKDLRNASVSFVMARVLHLADPQRTRQGGPQRVRMASCGTILLCGPL